MIRINLQYFAPVGIFQPVNGFLFDLADAFAREVKPFPDFVKSVRGFLTDAKVELENTFFPFI